MAETISQQLTMLGLEETLLSAEGATQIARGRRQRVVTQVHDLMTGLPEPDDIGFLHSGLCQTFLPHSKPDSNVAPWRRNAGRLTLMTSPGIIDKPPANGRQHAPDELESLYVGVPYGTKARLILIHLQTEGVKSRTVSLGRSLTAFMRSLNLAVTGGSRGSINGVREQCMRIARCSFTMQWSDKDALTGDGRTIIRDSRIAEGLEIWDRANDRSDWTGEVTLSEGFYEHLREHAVPLDKRALSLLSGNSLALDLYALFAHRAPKLQSNLFLRWSALEGQVGADTTTGQLARKIRQAMPMVKDAYQGLEVEVGRFGVTLKPTKPAVPRTTVNDYKLIEGSSQG